LNFYFSSYSDLQFAFSLSLKKERKWLKPQKKTRSNQSELQSMPFYRQNKKVESQKVGNKIIFDTGSMES